jgi:hypothetical protein
MSFQNHVSELLEENGEYVDAQALTLARAWVRYGGPDAAPVTTDGPHPEHDRCRDRPRPSGDSPRRYRVIINR